MPLLIHRARIIDCHGVADDSWVLVDGTQISAIGQGDDWRSVVADPGSVDIVDAASRTVVPGFIDLHVHGGGGSSFEDGAAAIRTGLAVHRRHGTTRSLVSLVSSPLDRSARVLEEIAAHVADDPLVIGAHLEGPFLSESRRGAHDIEALVPPTPRAIDLLLDAAGGHLRMVTLAPELDGALAAIARLVDAGAVVAIGHTAADYAQASAAFDAGATVVTHAYNAMPGLAHRAPGPVGAAFDRADVVLELVCDGHHVDPAVLRMTFAAAPGRVALVTDAMAATGAADGRYELGSRSVVVEAGVATVEGTSTLAGSTLTLDQALRNVIGWGVDPVAAVTAVTSTPARALGAEDWLGQLRPGYAADLVVLDGDWRVDLVVAGGERLAP